MKNCSKLCTGKKNPTKRTTNESVRNEDKEEVTDRYDPIQSDV